MELVTSIEQLQTLPAEIRAKRKGFITNFYLDPEKNSVWIAKGDCFTERIGDSLFVVRKDKAFWNVYYCSTTLEQLKQDLDAFINSADKIPLMFDILGRDVQCTPLVDMFNSLGCEEATSLVRMTRMTETMEYVEDKTVRKATAFDVTEISNQLRKYFDARTEQIPYDEELKEYVKQGHVLICEEEGNKMGFLIYELNATTLYLRYWFTHPNFRDKKVGSRLLRRFFEEGKGTKRQLFWVIRSNENAIKRYKHYGFIEENMYDFVLTQAGGVNLCNITLVVLATGAGCSTVRKAA